MWVRILCASAPRDAARSTAQLCTQLGHLNGHCLYNSSGSTCQVRSAAAVNSQGPGLHTHAESSFTARHSSSQSGSRASSNASSSSTISSWAGSAGVIFRHALFTAPPCMWAAQTPQEEHSSAAGDAEACSSKTKQQLASCSSLFALSDVYNKWGGSFNDMHASAAIAKYAKLKRRRATDTQLLPGGRATDTQLLPGGRATDTQLLPSLLHCWLQQLPGADLQGCANVLWALGKLSKLGTVLDEFWEPTFKSFLRLMEQDRQAHPGSPQHIPNILWACAKLRKQPAPDQLAVLMQAVLLPEVLAAANAQDLSNIVWSVGRLCQLKGWQGGISDEAIQQLLGPQQLQLLSTDGTPQAIANALLGLTNMSTSAAPVVSKAFAQQCSRKLLEGTAQRLVTSDPQHVSNSMWACGELGLADAAFLAAAAAAAAHWVPASKHQDVVQAATACAKLQFMHQGLMVALLQRGQLLLQRSGAQGMQQRTPHSLGLGPVAKDALVARLCSAVSHLNMQQLAPQALQLIESSGICQRPNTHEANLNRLWVFHSWLLQHQLTGGQGLTGLLTQQQLQRGQQVTAQYPDTVLDTCMCPLCVGTALVQSQQVGRLCFKCSGRAVSCRMCCTPATVCSLNGGPLGARAYGRQLSAGTRGGRGRRVSCSEEHMGQGGNSNLQLLQQQQTQRGVRSFDMPSGRAMAGTGVGVTAVSASQERVGRTSDPTGNTSGSFTAGSGEGPPGTPRASNSSGDFFSNMADLGNESWVGPGLTQPLGLIRELRGWHLGRLWVTAST